MKAFAVRTGKSSRNVKEKGKRVFIYFVIYLILSFVCLRKSWNCRPLFHNNGCLFPKSMFLYLLVESFKGIYD